MASLLRVLLEFLHRLRPAKDHIKRFLRRWTSLRVLAYLVRKMGEWRFLWPNKPGTVGDPKPAEPSFPSDSAGSFSVSGGSGYLGGIGGYAAATSTVPASANQPLDRERADLQSDSAPPNPMLSIYSEPLWAAGPSTTNRTVSAGSIQSRASDRFSLHSAGSVQSRANYSAGSVQSRASDRFSMISTSRTSLRSPAQNDPSRPSRDPRATFRQFGRGPRTSRSRGRSSRSPSPKSFLKTSQSDILDITSTGTHTYADGVINPTIGPQGLTDLPSSSSHTQGRPGRPAIRPQKQRRIGIGWNIQDPSTESLRPTAINAREITEEPMAMDTSVHSSLHISPSDRAETMASSATSALALPRRRFLQLINSDQIPRYTKNITM